MIKKLFDWLLKRELKVTTEVITTPSHVDNVQISQHQIDFNLRLTERIKLSLAEYSFVKKEKITFLANELMGEQFKHSKNILSLDEKKALNLNSRAKYAKEFIDCFEGVENFNFDPKSFCDNLKITERSIQWSLDELEKIKRDGLTKKVALEGKGDWDNKQYDISQVPPIPKLDYTKERILFFVIAKIEF